jgi:uncharacterized protein (DUF488 family)
MSTYYTVGHSTRALAEFLALLQGAGVERLVDVRAIPRSRTNPQFNIDTLPPALAEHGIDYEHLAELGGRRRGPPHSPNDFWENDSFRSYADYAGTEAFRAGLERLKKLGRERPAAVMCAEAVWWRCHRRIIADYLISEGETVLHILAPGKIEPAKLTPAARRTPDGTLIYPRDPD